MRDATRTPALVLLALVGAVGVGLAPAPADLSAGGQFALGTMVFAGALWVTGALPLPVTALTVPVLLTAFGVYPTLGGAVRGFADPVVFLLLAGFVLARALQVHGLDRRVAYALLARLGRSPRRLVLAVMLATALLSMVVSNTATTAMMVPVALGIVAEVDEVAPADAAEGPSNLHLAMVLGTAYAATVGGVGTVIGTPPNAIAVTYLDASLGYSVSFLDWLVVGLPMVAVTLPLTWYLVVRVYPPADVDVSAARDRARERLRESGPLDPAARRTLGVFLATAGLWLLGGLDGLFAGPLPADWHATLFGGGTSVFGTAHQGLLYYVLVGLVAIPALVAVDAADWEELVDIDWGTLVLLGGGISLANALADTGAIGWLADVVLGSLAGAPLLTLLVVVVAGSIAVGELASNTAMAAVTVPLLASGGAAYAATVGAGDATSAYLAIAGAVAVSYGFALPVATPPNAVVFGTGEVSRAHMLRAGVLLDVAMALTVATALFVSMRVVWPALLL